MKRIVVGVDGSSSSRSAVQAERSARLEGAKLRVVSAWHVPSVSYGGPIGFPLKDMRREFEDGARTIVDESVDQVLGGENGIPIERVVREGHAAKVLLEASDDADLLVVGCRGHGGFAELLLGSVSHECARHAHCPVLIVHKHEPNGI